MPFVSFLDEDAGMGEMMRARPDHMAPVNALAERMLRGESEFSVGERELMGAYVSGVNDCPYCYGAHAATATHFGVDASLVQTLLDDLDAAPVDERLKPVLRFQRKLTQTPYRMTQADADAVLAAGWSEAALSDAILICALFNAANRIVDGHGIRRDWAPGSFEGTGEHLATMGYRDPRAASGA